jgi:hypothetical protein
MAVVTPNQAMQGARRKQRAPDGWRWRESKGFHVKSQTVRFV